MASHDLQEPLRKIRIFSERIAETYAKEIGDDGKLFIDKMQSACIRMQNLIDDILAFSKIAVEKESLTHAKLNQLIDEVLIDMDQRIKEKNAKVTVGKLPELYVNPGLIKSLFQNLISNSLKYAKKEETPVINITARLDEPLTSSDNGNSVKKYWRILVQDNGIGFEQQYAEQVFTMFKRLHAGPEYKGTGIGLAICKKIVEEHNGHISARSNVNEGTTFTISLPVPEMVLN
jgi:light-regulated signal transduction histidine kinase (bacteriophytochrome)